MSQNEMNAMAAKFVVDLLWLVDNKAITFKEALQRAHQHGVSQGRIEAFDVAKKIIGAPA